jgi:hypothetical protein
VAHKAAGHLVQALVRGRAVVGAHSDIADVANDDGLHAIAVERGDKGGGLLVQGIAQLAIQPTQLPLLGADGLRP